MKKKFDLTAPYQPASFAFKDKKKVAEIIARYPKGQQQSAVMPLLDWAQRQIAAEGLKQKPPVGGWIPRAAMDHIAEVLDMPPMKVYEVATFYSMYNLQPVGKYLLQVCTTTPCWLCNSNDVMKAIKDTVGLSHNYETTADGYFTLLEVECLGACANAPMIQINDDFYEDLTYDSMVAVLQALQKDEIPPKGPQNGRKNSMALGDPTTLLDQAKKAGIKAA
ncbi:MAG: NAD(P)H-dependent oxidoreductase subunit E [Rhodospirillales bacterium]|nr:NAD(P)H-dependent oxidoreductase subunit E [Rhodospirillales bacterium]MCB9964903.1 NAD(P)H-dependent oxidoreductase subunit E [Rhodospirillales bacterium]